jgi:hypothetical protein
MKRLSLLKIVFLWRLEQLAGELWGLLCFDRPSYFLDFLPAYFYQKRKQAENRHFVRFNENIYGQSI